MTLERYRQRLRDDLAGLEGPGVEVARRLVAKLRFERLLRGSVQAERWFEEDPAAFARAFARYRREVPARHWFPQEEAVAFHAWLADVPRGTE